VSRDRERGTSGDEVLPLIVSSDEDGVIWTDGFDDCEGGLSDVLGKVFPAFERRFFDTKRVKCVGVLDEPGGSSEGTVIE